MTLGDRDGTGDWLQYLHQLLVRHGYATGTAEVYDEATEQAVRAFQGQYGLPETGVADAGTWHALQFEPGSNWTDFRLAFQEFPGVRDGALVWTLRNDGPYPASQFVEHATFVDYDTADEAGTATRTAALRATSRPSRARTTRVVLIRFLPLGR